MSLQLKFQIFFEKKKNLPYLNWNSLASKVAVIVCFVGARRCFVLNYTNDYFVTGKKGIEA